MTERRDNIKTIIVAGLIIIAVTWTADVIADVFIDSQGDLMTSLFSPGLSESAERLAIIIIVFGIVGYFIELSKNHRKIIRDQNYLKEIVDKLKDGPETIKKLKSLLPSCPTCDGIRDDFGSWHELDIYMEKYPDATYAEGYCPGCTKKMNLERQTEALF
ncbi:MAG: hypothetical protein V3V95_05615 [Thermodesulfobacteriota bacterium]